MSPKVKEQIEALSGMTVAELRARYAEVFAEEAHSRHKVFLQKRIAWGLQAAEEGGLSERARRRAEELANDADLRLLAPTRGRTVTQTFTPSHDRRLPMPGSALTRKYRGRTVSVTVLDEGFEYQGKVYKSLTAVANAITGGHWSGPAWFGLARRGEHR